MKHHFEENTFFVVLLFNVLSSFMEQCNNKLICCEFKGKQASKIESTSLFCISYTVLHVKDQKNEWSVFVE